MKCQMLFLILVLLVFTGCSTSNFIADSSQATEENVIKTIDANNQFALDLYKENIGEKNIFFSPYSITTALAMTYEGARGETAKEIKDVFKFLDDDIQRRSSFAAIYNAINGNHEEYKLFTANALWLENTYQLEPLFTASIANYYDGYVTNLDFINNPQISRKTINSWIEDKTNNKIIELLKENDIKPNTKLVLTNAIYFKGDWLKEFDEKDTTELPFYVNDVVGKNVETMYLKEKFKYIETEDLQILSMLYKGEQLQMKIYLPKEKDISILENQLTIENLKKWDESLLTREVEVYLPKFKFDTRYLLKENLINMGMPLAFSDDADFSGMNKMNDLKIGSVIHQAFVEVDEKGTEAAAATAVIVVSKSSAFDTSATFKADHSFIFTISDVETGTILFMGKVNDPTA
jgi:serpin B